MIKRSYEMKQKIIVLLIYLLILVACRSIVDTNMSGMMKDFEFTTQDEINLSLQDLKGQWWIANFMYTNCRTVCPRTTANMATVQQELEDEGYQPLIISFTVDPDYDTPKKLKEYALKNNLNLDTWSFLTGYDFTTIQEISEVSFKAILQDGAVGQRSHSYGFYLVNPDGKIIKKYDGMSR